MIKKILATFVVALLFSTAAIAQEEEEMMKFEVDLSVGVALALGEDADTFSSDGIAGLFHADILGFDFLDATSGLGGEVKLANDIQYQVWSLNRATIPNTNGVLYAGTDMKMFQSDDLEGAKADFDLRLVSGTRLGQLGPGTVNFEIYFIEEDRPISFGVLYSW
jgi:hypothetical protein